MLTDVYSDLLSGTYYILLLGILCSFLKLLGILSGIRFGPAAPQRAGELAVVEHAWQAGDDMLARKLACVPRSISVSVCACLCVCFCLSLCVCLSVSLRVCMGGWVGVCVRALVRVYVCKTR